MLVRNRLHKLGYSCRVKSRDVGYLTAINPDDVAQRALQLKCRAIFFVMCAF